jgi:ORF6N domain-containing protein
MNEEMDPQSEASRPPLLAENISRRILTVRGHRVMLDADLAELYGVPTSRMNEAVKRNSIRFPEDFMFRLSAVEYTSLISQIAISKPGRRGGRRKLPYVFTEQGVAMLSSVLNSDRAIQVNITIMRAFVRMRKTVASHRGLAQRMNTLERTYDAKFRIVFDAIRALMEPPKTSRRRIGF